MRSASVSSVPLKALLATVTLYDFLIIKSAPFVSTLATLFFVKSLNKNALELFLTSRVTLNKSFTVVSAEGKSPEHKEEKKD